MKKLNAWLINMSFTVVDKVLGNGNGDTRYKINIMHNKMIC